MMSHPMINRAGVLVVTSDPQTAKSVNDVIGPNDDAASRGVYRTLDDLAVALERNRAAAVIVDIDPQPNQMLDELESIVNHNLGTRFIALSSQDRSDLMVQAMQAGVRHFLTKDKVKTDLLSVVQRLAPATGSRNGWHGSVITVLSAGGGSGATTFSINLANELHLLTTKPTLLVDMDCSYGAAAGYLGITAKYGIADLLASSDRIDAQLIRSTAVPHNEHLHVLASPATVDLDAPLSLAYEHLNRLLQKARETYAFTVNDAPRVSLDAAASLSNASLMTYILLQMNVENIRVARAMNAGLVKRGVPAELIMPLVSRFRGRREMISMDDAKRAIGSTQIGYLSNDYKGVLASNNFGKPLAENAPRSPLRYDIQNLAKTLQNASTAAKRAGALR
jgi:pilus assembly protein CpaE